MSVALSGEVHMRDGANRAFGYAILASLLLHALLLLALPSLRGFVELRPSPPLRLSARIVEIAPAPAAVPKPTAHPQARPPAARPVPVSAPVPEPVVQAPLTQPQQPVASEPVQPPAAPITPATPGPVARLESRPEPPAAPAPVPESAARDHYRASLNSAAARFKRYPRAAIDNSWQGEVLLSMTIGANGRIASLRVRSSSGYDILDRQALDMFRNAKPFVAIPPELLGQPFELELRAIYSLRDQGSG